MPDRPRLQLLQHTAASITNQLVIAPAAPAHRSFCKKPNESLLQLLQHTAASVTNQRVTAPAAPAHRGFYNKPTSHCSSCSSTTRFTTAIYAIHPQHREQEKVKVDNLWLPHQPRLLLHQHADLHRENTKQALGGVNKTRQKEIRGWRE